MIQPERISAADLFTELQYLRKGRGATPDRLPNAPELLKAFGGKAQVYDTLKARLISAIQSLPDEPSRTILLSAYGFLPDTAQGISLRDRRELLGQQIGRKYDTIANREDKAISELVVQLLTASYAGAPVAATLPLPHGAFLIESLEMHTLICDKQFISHTQTRTVIALADRPKSFQFDSNETTRLIGLKGCHVESEPVVSGDKPSTRHIILLDDPPRRGKSYTFSFKEVSDEPPNPDIKQDRAGQSFETPAYRYIQRVTFEGEKPKVIWWYDKLSWVTRPGKPEPANTIQFASGSNTVKHEFAQQYNGLFSGVAWEW